jgi:colanic acid biosynthesis glycosyl transferase WcaI
MSRVIFVNRYFFPDHSATSQLASDLAFDLAGRGAEVLAITSRQRYDAPAISLPADDIVRGLHITRVWTTRFGRGQLLGRALDYLSFYLSASLRLLLETRSDSIIVAMTDPPLISIPARAIAWLHGARLVNWLQDVFPEVAERLGVMRAGIFYACLRRARDWTLRGATVNVVIGQRMAALVSSHAGGAPVKVIPNWALEEIDTPDKAPNALRAEWGVEAAFVVGYSGNMGRAHALESLLDAAARLKDAKGIVFLLIGEGAQRAALQARAQALGLGNVIFKPYQTRENLRASLTVPDLHVVSLDDRLEGLIVPSKFVGVIAVGKPVLYLGDANGEIGTWVGNSACGIVVGAQDSAAIAAAVTRLASDRTALAAMTTNAHELWQREFRRRDTLAAWAAVLGYAGG